MARRVPGPFGTAPLGILLHHREHGRDPEPIVIHNPPPKRKAVPPKKSLKSKKANDGYEKVGPFLVRNDGQVCVPASSIGGRMIMTLDPSGEVRLGEPLTPAEAGANLAKIRGPDGGASAIVAALCSEISRLGQEVERLRARLP